MESALERLVAAVEYPESLPAGARSATLQVDGGEVFAEETGGRIRLARKLTEDAGEWPLLAACAPGRMLREEAILACDREGAFLWQEIPSAADARDLRRRFETFCDSCDWWRARLEGGRDEPAASRFPEMMIRP